MISNVTEQGEKKMYTLQLASKSESICQVENFVEDLRKNYKIGEESFGNILTALTEAVNNAIIHGNKYDESKKVYINLEVEGSRKLSFTIADEGKGFDYDDIPDPTLAENIEVPNGRGVFIMKHLADQFIYNKPGNQIELHFNI